MDQELLKRLLDFLADQGAELNRWEAKRLALGLDCEAKTWHIKDRDFVDYLVDRCLHKDKTFWKLCEKIWQTSLEFGPLYQPFLYSPFHPWMEWRAELTQELRKLMVQESSTKRLSQFSPVQIASWVVQTAQKSQLWPKVSALATALQKEQWENLLASKALATSYEDFDALMAGQTVHTSHTQSVDLFHKYESLVLSSHQLNLLYRLRARQQIESLVEQFHHAQQKDKTSPQP
jgi:hypothetical protein